MLNLDFGIADCVERLSLSKSQRLGGDSMPPGNRQPSTTQCFGLRASGRLSRAGITHSYDRYRFLRLNSRRIRMVTSTRLERTVLNDIIGQMRVCDDARRHITATLRVDTEKFYAQCVDLKH